MVIRTHSPFALAFTGPTRPVPILKRRHVAFQKRFSQCKHWNRGGISATNHWWTRYLSCGSCCVCHPQIAGSAGLLLDTTPCFMPNTASYHAIRFKSGVVPRDSARNCCGVFMPICALHRCCGLMCCDICHSLLAYIIRLPGSRWYYLEVHREFSALDSWR